MAQLGYGELPQGDITDPGVKVTTGIQAFDKGIQPEGTEIKAYDEESHIMIPDAVIDNQVAKYHFGLGDKSPGKDQLKSETKAGKEDQYRQYRSAKQDLEDLNTQQEFVNNLARARTPGTPLTKQEREEIDKLTPEDYDKIRNNPVNFYEQEFSKRVLDAAVDAGLHRMIEGPTGAEAEYGVTEQGPNGVQFFTAVKGAAQDIITRQQVLERILEQREAKWSEMSYASRALSIGATMVPGVSVYDRHMALAEITSSWFPGETFGDAIDHIWNIPITDVPGTANRLLDEMEARSPANALALAQAFVKYSTENQFLDNSTLVADIGFLGPSLLKAGRAGMAFRPSHYVEAMKDIIKTTATRTFRTADIAEAAGDYNAAGQIKGLDIIKNLANGIKPGSYEELRAALPSGWDFKAAVEAANKGSDERARRFATALQTDRNVLLRTIGKAIVDPFPINRLDPGLSAYRKAIDDTDDLFKTQFPHAVNSILDIRTLEQEDTFGGLYRQYDLGHPSGVVAGNIFNLKDFEEFERVGTPLTMRANNENMEIRIGTKQATLFETEEAARFFADHELGLSGYKIRTRGAGFWIQYNKAVAERTTNVAEALRIETEFETPRNRMNALLGAVGSGAKRVSRQYEEDLLTAAYGASGLIKMAERVGKPIRDLKWSKREFEELREFMAHQQNQLDPATKAPGKFSETPGDFDKDFAAWHKDHKLPSLKQARAYFATTGMSDADLILREIRATIEKVRNGAELHGLPYRSVDVNGGAVSNKPKPTIEGRVLPDMKAVWENQEDAGVMVYSQDLDKIGGHLQKDGEAGYFRTQGYVPRGWKAADRRAYIDDLLTNKGYRAIHVSPWGRDALNNLEHMTDAAGKSYLPNRPVDYIITKDLTSEPLGLYQFPRRPGFHHEYPIGHFVSQPKVSIFGEGAKKTAMYYGDTHGWFHPSEKEAIKFTEMANQARIMLRDGNPELYRFWPSRMPGELKDFVNAFNGHDPIFDINTPFYTKHTGTNVAMEQQLQNYYRETHAATFKKASESTHNLYGNSIDMRYLGERGAVLRSFQRIGDMDAPIYRVARTNLIDPMTVTNRAFSSMLRNQYLSDLRIKAANGFVAEFGHLLDTSKYPGGLEALKKDPFAALVSIPWKQGISGREREEWLAARNFRRATINFLGIKNDTENQAWAWKQDLVNQMNESFPNQKMEQIEPWLLHQTRDVNNLAKNFAFLSTQSLLRPAVFLAQAMTFTFAMAVEGFTRGFKALGHSFYMGMADMAHPDLHGSIAKLATPFGGKEEHWLESYRAWKMSGMERVGGEHQLRDNYFEQRVVQNSTGRFLDFVGFFFDRGELYNRRAAWNMAYDRWRTANPKAVFTNAAAQEVLQRADVLSGSMTRASRATWQTGVLSVPTQFMAYPARIMETIWGRDLTWPEKGRFMARYSAMFGFPSTLSTVAPWPWPKAVQGELRDRYGIDVDDNLITKVMNDGFMGLLAQGLAGQKQNVASKFGAQGGLGNTLSDIREGKTSIIQLLGGPSGAFEPIGAKQEPSLVWDTVKAGGDVLFGVPLAYAKALYEGKPMPNKRIQLQSLIDFARTTASGNDAMQFFYAMSLGKFINKNEETLLDNVSTRQAWFTYLTGLRPYKIEEMYDIQASEVMRKNAQKGALDYAKRMWNVMLRSTSQEDQKAALEQVQIAVEAAGFDNHEKFQFLKQMSRNSEDKFTQTMAKWGLEKQENYDYAIKQLRK